MGQVATLTEYRHRGLEKAYGEFHRQVTEQGYDLYTIQGIPLVFVQLLVGHRNRQELESIYPNFNIRQSHKHLINMLFPKLPSHTHAAY